MGNQLDSLNGSSESSSIRLKLLLIGALPPPIGGATTLFKHLIDDLTKDSRYKIKIINFSRTQTNPVIENSNLANILTYISVIFQTIFQGWRSDVISLHASDRGKLYLSPAIYIISRILRKPFIVRSFGGGFEGVYESINPVLKWVIRKTYFNSDMCLFETKFLIEYFNKLSIRRTEWFSNYTRINNEVEEINNSGRKECRRYIFLGRVNKVKGMEVILESESLLTDGVEIDVFGPLYDGYSEENINRRGNGRIRYKGIIGMDEIRCTLMRYDAHVLPTFYPNEGYPGTILEAWACGLPVIATSWRAIPEIVDETCGFLVKPGDVKDFADAVNTLSRDSELYMKVRKGAIEKSKYFTSEHWTDRFVKLCYELVNDTDRQDNN